MEFIYRDTAMGGRAYAILPGQEPPTDQAGLDRLPGYYRMGLGGRVKAIAKVPYHQEKELESVEQAQKWLRDFILGGS